MKKLQILNAARYVHMVIWAVIALTLFVEVCKQWTLNGCGFWTLVAMILFYGSCISALCLVGNAMFNEEIADEKARIELTSKKTRKQEVK